MEAALWGDLSLNLVAEAIGIAVTVFFIDQLIKKREESRRLPARQHLYREAARLTDRLLGLIPIRYTSTDMKVYRFGLEDAYLFRSMKSGLALEKFHADLKETLEREELSGRGSSNAPSCEELDALRSEIDRLLTVYSSIAEAQLIEALASANGQMEYCGICVRTGNFSSCAIALHNIVIITSKLRVWLQKKADRMLTFDEAMAEFAGSQKS